MGDKSDIKSTITLSLNEDWKHFLKILLKGKNINPPQIKRVQEVCKFKYFLDLRKNFSKVA